ncbi:MAG: hypothetical protein HQL54_12445 [Magnetococcales bacterium]|nr:hypothetical protein [Magnetococcales bacterium]
MTAAQDEKSGFSEKSPSEDFAKYSREEIHRRKESDTGFDETLYEEAVSLTIDRLKALESEGMQG